MNRINQILESKKQKCMEMMLLEPQNPGVLSPVAMR